MMSASKSVSGLWNGLLSQDVGFGNHASYYEALLWLSTCSTIHDWGCGGQLFKSIIGRKYPHIEVLGIDGSGDVCDILSDLTEYQPAEIPEGLLMRHVLGHNYNWRDILQRALESFTSRMFLSCFVPLHDHPDELIYTHHIGCPVLRLCRPDLEDLLDSADVNWCSYTWIRTGNEFPTETIFPITRK